MEEPKQGKYGLWYVSGVSHGFPSKEHAEQYLHKVAEDQNFKSKVETMPSAKAGGTGKLLGYGKFEWVFSIIAALIVIFLFRSCTGADDSTSKAERMVERADKRCVDSSLAWTMSQRYVKNNLLSPASAKFPALPVAAEHIDGCTHVVVGEFEAQNGFGVMIKHRFSATMTYNKEADTWSGSDINIQ